MWVILDDGTSRSFNAVNLDFVSMTMRTGWIDSRASKLIFAPKVMGALDIDPLSRIDFPGRLQLGSAENLNKIVALHVSKCNKFKESECMWD